MEKDDRVAVVPVAMGWSDLGCWHTIHALAEKDAADNAVTGDAFLHDSRGNLVRAGGKRVSILGMDNIAVIVDGADLDRKDVASGKSVSVSVDLGGRRTLKNKQKKKKKR